MTLRQHSRSCHPAFRRSSKQSLHQDLPSPLPKKAKDLRQIWKNVESVAHPQVPHRNGPRLDIWSTASRLHIAQCGTLILIKPEINSNWLFMVNLRTSLPSLPHSFVCHADLASVNEIDGVESQSRAGSTEMKLAQICLAWFFGSWVVILQKTGLEFFTISVADINEWTGGRWCMSFGDWG